MITDVSGDDVDLWRCRTGFKNQFSTKETWYLLQEEKPLCVWTKGVWFKKATPKFSFVTWIAMLDRFTTMDRVSKWSAGVDETCVLCKNAAETRDHLFFKCSFSSQIWMDISHGILQGSYTTTWSALQVIVSDQRLEAKKLYCIRYAFQCAIHVIWRERNKRRHGEDPTMPRVLAKFIDKSIRNKLRLVTALGGKFTGILSYWFGSRDIG